MHLGTMLNTLGQTLYHFNGVAPIVTGTSNPIILNKKYKQGGMPDSKRQELVRQEAANQVVTMIVHLIMYYGLSMATAAILKRKLPAIETWMKKSIGEGKFQNLAKGSKLIKEALIETTDEQLARVGGKAFDKTLKKTGDQALAAQAKREAVQKTMEKIEQKAAKQAQKKDKLEVENIITAKVFEYIKIIVANLGGLLGFGIVRPLLGATLFKHLNKKSGGGTEQAKNAQMRPYFDPSQANAPLRRIGEPKASYQAYQRTV